MANITIVNNASYVGGVNVSQANSVQLTVGDVAAFDNVSIPTSNTLLDLGAITSPALIQVKNSDATNYVLLSVDTHVSYPIKISPLSAVTVELDSVAASAVYLKAHTSTCIVSYVAC